MSAADELDVALARAAATLALIAPAAAVFEDTGLTGRDLRVLLDAIDPREVTPSAVVRRFRQARARPGPTRHLAACARPDPAEQSVGFEAASGSVTTPCMVEAFDGDVVLECGSAGTSLIPSVAGDAGERLIEEADYGDRGTAHDDLSAGS